MVQLLSEPQDYEKYIRHRLAADWCYDHVVTATIQMNALKSCISDYRNILQQCLLGELLHDLMDEYKSDAKLDQAKMMLGQFTLPDYLYGDSAGTFNVLRGNIRNGIRLLLCHNAVMDIVAKEVKMPDVYDYFSIGFDDLQ